MMAVEKIMPMVMYMSKGAVFHAIMVMAVAMPIVLMIVIC
jgi:hypothetical protein